MNSFAWWPTLIVVAVATFTDLRNRRIPNWLVLPFLLAGIVVSAWMHGWHGMGQSFAGMGLGLLIYGFLFWMGGMGAGDVKLCVAIGAWIGDRKPLILEGNPKGWLVQIETIVATHLARPEPGAPANHARGILPMEIASHIQLLVSGNWFQKDMITPGSGTDPVSSALVTGNGMVLVNPVDVDQFYRQEIRAGQVLPGRIISLAEYRKEVREFPGRRAVPSAMP